MKSSNKKENTMNLNESSDEEKNEEEENSSNDVEEQEKQNNNITTNIFIHLTLITQLIKKSNGEYPCICRNLSKEDVLSENNININNNNNNSPQMNNPNEINNTSQNTSSFIEEEIIPNLEINTTTDKKIFMKDIISKFRLSNNRRSFQCLHKIRRRIRLYGI